MYNGIGLKTPRGSGTSGYVQKNLSFVKPKTQNYDPNALPPKKHVPSDDILLYRSKRQVEVECLEYEEELLSSGDYTEEEVREKVDAFQKRQYARLEDKLQRSKKEVLIEEKQMEMERLREAFGIEKGAKEGRAFNFESEQERGERLARIAEEERKQEKKRVYHR